MYCTYGLDHTRKSILYFEKCARGLIVDSGVNFSVCCIVARQNWGPSNDVEGCVWNVWTLLLDSLLNCAGWLILLDFCQPKLDKQTTVGDLRTGEDRFEFLSTIISFWAITYDWRYKCCRLSYLLSSTKIRGVYFYLPVAQVSHGHLRGFFSAKVWY